MSVARMWAARFRGLFWRRRTGRLDEELQAHLEMLAADYIRRGMAEQEARRAARRDLGNITVIAEDYREQDGIPLVETFGRDLRFSLRTLRRSPGYTACCAATLAVGLGAMIAVLAVVSDLLWKPLPYPHSERLVAIQEIDPRGGAWTFSEPDLLDMEQRSQSLAAIGAFQRRTSALTGAGDPETIPSAAVTPSCFALFGIRPLAGSVLGQPQQVVIGRALWERKWHGSPSVIGRPVALDGESYTIAGVADLPADLLPGVELLLPLLPKATESRTAHEIEAVGRMRAGVTLGQAQAELNTVAHAIARDNPRSNAGWGMRPTALADYIAGPRTGRTVWMIFGAVALLWVLACANVAGLQVARGMARRHEMSTRMALGAGRLRLWGQTLTENMVLALVGSALGLAVAQYATAAIRHLGAQALPRLAELHLDARTIAISLACLFISTLLCSLLPGRPPRFQGGRAIAQRDRGRDLLIVAQVVLASVLLLAAGLLLHSFLRLRAVDPGFDPDRILAVKVNLAAPGYDDARRVAFFRDATARLERLPQVESVGATNIAPFSGQGTANRFRLEGEPDTAEYRSAAWRAVTPGFFATLGLPLKRGRLFTERDADGALQTVIVSESMARRFWPGQDPVGKRLLWGRSGHPKTIVGVVGDLRDLAVDAPPAPTMFRPFAQLSEAPMTLLIRTEGNPTAAGIAGFRKAIWAADRNAALEFQPVRLAMSDFLLRPRVSLAAFAVFALIALVTAGFGLYGLISYRVSQRQQEIGVRLALGCPAGAVRWSVQKRCLALVCCGLAIGLPAAYALSTLLTSLLYQTQPTEAGAYTIVVTVFATVALAASYGPARRASRLDPAAAIRHE
jgi:putative ABC transport system permease protein